MGQVLSIVAEKGGCGKTTLATNIATALERAGRKVLLVDCDPQHTAYSWAHLPGEGKPHTVLGEYRRLARTVRDIQAEFDWIVIDNAPGVSRDTATAIEAADIALIPLRPGADLWAAKTTVSLARAAMDARPELRAALVLTQELHGTVIGRAVWAKLEGLGLPVLNTRVEMRVAYAEALITGQSIFGTTDTKAHHEIESITSEIERLWAKA